VKTSNKAEDKQDDASDHRPMRSYILLIGQASSVWANREST